MFRSLFLLCVLALPAQAYPWMVRHGYGSCATCHVDPSGSGQLTDYGRAQDDILVKWRTQPRKDDEELPKTVGFLWFAELPDWLNLSGNLRYGSLIRPQSGPKFLGGYYIPLLMAADLYVTLNFGPVVAHASTGIGIRNTGPATILPLRDASASGSYTPTWIAREFWLGVNLADDSVMIRAGRQNLPFGLRNSEHTSYVRALTRTDFNISQQVGASISYNGEKLRGEVMGIVGNFQLGPDLYRERGYSGFAEYSFNNAVNVGVSSLITYAGADLTSLLPTVRHAHGAFGRFVPAEKFAILAEADFLMWQVSGQADRLGFAAFVQGDWEPVQGLHVMVTGESSHTGSGERGANYGGWLSAAWYFFGHCELRLDNVFRRKAVSGGAGQFEYNLLLQLHAYL